MRTFAFLPFVLVPAALVAQAPVQSLGDRVKAERPAIEQLMAELNYPEAMKRSEALIPATRPTFNKTDNTTLVQSCGDFLDLAAAYRLAAETADSAGAWEKALEYAKAARTAATESYEGVKVPFTKTAADFALAGARAKQVLLENDARIKELKAKTNLEAGDRQELDLAIGVEKEVTDSAKWSKFFQTYVDVAKRESGSYDPLVKVMEDKLKGEADQVAEYHAGKGDRLKWVEAVISTPAYLEAQGDRAGRARWLYRLITIAPDNKKVQHQLDVLTGKAAATPHKAVKKRN